MAVQAFDDELDNIQPTKTAAAATQPAASAAPAKAAESAATTASADVTAEDIEDESPAQASATKAQAAADDEAEDVDFGDEEVMKRPDQLNRCRPEKKGEAVRFAFLPKEWLSPKKGYVHWVEANGKKQRVRCLHTNEENYCCTKLGKDGEVHVNALVLRYTNADPKNGKYVKDAKGAVPPIEWAIEYVDLSRANFTQVSKLPEEDQTVYDIDIVMTLADRAFGYELSKVSSKARWKQNPALVEEVRQAAQKFVKDGGKKLIATLGKKLNLLEMKALLSGVASGAQEARLDDVEEL
jgi:hypothetical protein